MLLHYLVHRVEDQRVAEGDHRPRQRACGICKGDLQPHPGLHQPLLPNQVVQTGPLNGLRWCERRNTSDHALSQASTSGAVLLLHCECGGSTPTLGSHHTREGMKLSTAAAVNFVRSARHQGTCSRSWGSTAGHSKAAPVQQGYV